MIFNVSGGGTGLNFSVVSYTTEENLLAATHAENTVGIVPQVDVSSWIFSPLEPAEPEPGVVWFTIGTSSPGSFNLLKKNSIEICPISAKQYVTDAWVEIPAMNYLNGSWVRWVTDISIYDNGATEHKLTLTNATDKGNYISLTLATRSNATVKSDAITLSGQSQLVVKYSYFGGDGTFAGKIYAKAWPVNGGDEVTSTAKSGGTDGRRTSGTVVLDISGLSGQYKVGVYASNNSGSNSGSCQIKSINIVT